MSSSDEVERAVLVIAKEINEKTKKITNREDWESETSDIVDAIAECIFEELELMWIDNGGSPP